jgi:hypothetical protein
MAKRESAALAQLRANARPGVLLSVVKCGASQASQASHLMRAKDRDVQRISCGRGADLAPGDRAGCLDVEMQEAGEHLNLAPPDDERTGR